MRRRLQPWTDLRDVLQLEPPALRRRDRVERAASILDLRRLAAARAPRAVFDYVDGGAEVEASLRRSRRLFRDLELRPRVLVDVSEVDASTTLLGGSSALPLALAPTGFTRMMHTAGEPAVARAAARAGVPYALSTMGTTSPEELAAASTHGRRWFQLYVFRDRGATKEVIARARASGFDSLVLTVDTPVPGARLRDVRNGLTIPPRLTWRTLLDGALHPAWWFDLVTTPPLEFASFRSFDGTVAELVAGLFDPSVELGDVAWLRDQWDGPLMIKGVQSVHDAVEVVEAGADAVLLSNHGGRQLDRSPEPLRLVRPTVEALDGRAEVHVDGGMLSGADVVAAVALGATGALLGRAYLYGLMAGGEPGVDRALAILAEDVRRTMQLLGARTVADLTPDMVRLPDERW